MFHYLLRKIQKNMKRRLNEDRLNKIVARSVRKVLAENVWGDPNGLPRKFGDEWLRQTLNLMKKHNMYADPSRVIAILRPVVTQFIEISKIGNDEKDDEIVNDIADIFGGQFLGKK
jgi:hypothetical protein